MKELMDSNEGLRVIVEAIVNECINNGIENIRSYPNDVDTSSGSIHIQGFRIRDINPTIYDNHHRAAYHYLISLMDAIRAISERIHKRKFHDALRHTISGQQAVRDDVMAQERLSVLREGLEITRNELANLSNKDSKKQAQESLRLLAFWLEGGDLLMAKLAKVE